MGFNAIFNLIDTMTIYERLGDDLLAQLIDRFYDSVLADERIAHLFKNDIESIKTKQFQFLTQFFGGPARYTEAHGHPRMRLRHMPHQITTDAAHAWLENMSAAIDSLPIEHDFKVEILQRFPHVAAHMVNS